MGWTAFAVFSNSLGFIEAVFLGTTLIRVSTYAVDTIRQSNSYYPQKIDVILCSSSGNTGHYTQKFVDSMQGDGRNVVVHRFHRKEEFNPVLGGDTLVLAFPVSGWKPPSNNKIFVRRGTFPWHQCKWTFLARLRRCGIT